MNQDILCAFSLHAWGTWSQPLKITFGGPMTNSHRQMGQIRACLNCNQIRIRRIRGLEHYEKELIEGPSVVSVLSNLHAAPTR
jgi:hypothetical protein